MPAGTLIVPPEFTRAIASCIEPPGCTSTSLVDAVLNPVIVIGALAKINPPVTVGVPVPVIVSALFTVTVSVYVPATAVIVSPSAVVPASIAACIEEKYVLSFVFSTGANAEPLVINPTAPPSPSPSSNHRTNVPLPDAVTREPAPVGSTNVLNYVPVR